MPRVTLLNALARQFPDISRDELYRSVMCGEVRDALQTYTDPHVIVPSESIFTITRVKYVGRGGEKLEAALNTWNIGAVDRCWLDAGASTGGFTDCLLQHGASRVHAVDVGYNQLDFRLRRDTRVVVHERTNILETQELDPIPDAAVCDLSFRSLRGVLRHILDLTSLGWGIALLKPQFEAAAEIRWGRRPAIDAGSGIIENSIREEIVSGTINALESDEGVRVIRHMPSPLPGRHGNREELLLVGRFEAFSCGSRPT